MNENFEVYAVSLILDGLRLPKELLPIEGPESGAERPLAMGQD